MLGFFKKNSKLCLYSLFFVAFIFFFFQLNPVLADSTGYNSNTGSSDATLWGQTAEGVQNRIGLGNDDPRYIIANIINLALGFLGIIAIVIIMYAGFMWMMSGGNPDKISLAKKTLISGIIGLIIVLSAFALASFAIDAIYRVTTGANLNGGGNSLGGSGGYGGGSGLGSLPMQCSSSGDMCVPNDSYCQSNFGAYYSCDARCQCVIDNTDSCYNPSENLCNIPCRAGLSCTGSSGCSDNSCGLGDSSCECCCDMTLAGTEEDQCKLMYPTLSCTNVEGRCPGADKGVCCGCSSDAQCGYSSGCSDDTCCRPRPVVQSVIPSDSSSDVCTNSEIRITFNQNMNAGSLSKNVLIVGEYGSTCPSDTRYLDDASILSAFSFGTSGLNACVINGTSRSVGDDVIFSPNSFLDVSTLYHVIILGDLDLNDETDQGILSFWGVSMDGHFHQTFTTISDQNGTGGVCVVENVNIEPSSYLFKTSQDSASEDDSVVADNPTFDTVRDGDKLFIAQALSGDNQVLSPMDGYNWDWVISSHNEGVARFDNVSDLAKNERLVQAVPGVVDGRSVIEAVINMNPYSGSNSSMMGDGLSAEAPVYLFVCENPWPPIENGVWEPWKPNPNTYNYDIYYCRDDGGVGTFDDLPAFDSVGTSGSLAPGVMSQHYFSYKAPPPVGSIQTISNVESSSDGGAVHLSWTPVSGAAGYKVYWGTRSGDYDSYVEIPGNTEYTAEKLENGKTYYFNVTSYTSDNSESSFFGEKYIIPKDESAPDVVTGFEISDVVSSYIKLSWNELADADRYEVSYGLFEGPPFGAVLDAESYTSIVIQDLNPDTTYYFGVRALDESDNPGPFSEILDTRTQE
ncbi:hypothetical protein C0583_06330 [Candidatus Parcubacteria bacterium]|nr:MAG: hypothetical protein C0583_06330 [Candidatus Parcubacteria bacterium]